ncbi:MAG TPA: sigma factor [Chloroflexota bacterium]|nr:sigma factor [Chloroflexota bacterium]
MNVDQVVDEVFRQESGRILASLIAQTGDFTLAEDALQDACVAALQTWPSAGVPHNPAAWLNSVGRRKAIDLLRRAGRWEEAMAAYGRALELCRNTVERHFLQRRLSEMAASSQSVDTR